jgi:hypothetical protein
MCAMCITSGMIWVLTGASSALAGLLAAMKRRKRPVGTPEPHAS